MHTLKDIARRMDCHPRTAKRWWRRLDALQALAGRPSVAPDVPGHGPHRWHDETADRLIQLYENFFKAVGTTPQLYKQKFAGKPIDEKQLTLSLAHNELTTAPRILPRRMDEIDNGTKKGSHVAQEKAPAKKGARRRAAAAQ